MESSVFLAADETIEHAVELVRFRKGDQVPVVGRKSRLVGIVTARDLDSRPF
jgi:CBS domain-containing protein